MAVYEPDFPHWLYLTEYNPGDIRKAAEKFVKGDIASLTWGQVTSKQNFITYSVYSDYTLEEYKGDLWSKNLDNIYWLLNRIAEKYIEASESHAGVYNAYKHGLRMKTGPSVITMRLQDQSRNPTGQRLLAGASQDSFQFLRIEKVDQGKKRPHYIIKHFSPRESFFHICKMRQLIEIVKCTRLARLNGETLTAFNTFFDLDKNYVMSLRGDNTTFSFTL